MIDTLVIWQPYLKALHVVSVIAWMAGLFYLPRLFVYHAEIQSCEDTADSIFQKMERRLLRAIMTPACISSWVFGMALALTPGVVQWSEVWPWTKAVAVLGMTTFHFWLIARQKDFAVGTNRLSAKSYRIMNEVPTILMLVIVFSVVLKF